jgi:hypothetical protein
MTIRIVMLRMSKNIRVSIDGNHCDPSCVHRKCDDCTAFDSTLYIDPRSPGKVMRCDKCLRAAQDE